MAYDEALADRIRSLIVDEPALTEKKMFGGLAFLVGGNMAISASGQGGLLVRVDPAESAADLKFSQKFIVSRTCLVPFVPETPPDLSDQVAAGCWPNSRST